jgi:hypothetical protein
MDLEKFNTLKAHIDTILEEMDIKVDETTELGHGFRWELDIAPFGFMKLDLLGDDHLWLSAIPTTAADIDTFVAGQFSNLLTLLGKVHLDDQFFIDWNYPDGWDNEAIGEYSVVVIQSTQTSHTFQVEAKSQREARAAAIAMAQDFPFEGGSTDLSTDDVTLDAVHRGDQA